MISLSDLREICPLPEPRSPHCTVRTGLDQKILRFLPALIIFDCEYQSASLCVAALHLILFNSHTPLEDGPYHSLFMYRRNETTAQRSSHLPEPCCSCVQPECKPSSITNHPLSELVILLSTDSPLLPSLLPSIAASGTGSEEESPTVDAADELGKPNRTQHPHLPFPEAPHLD